MILNALVICERIREAGGTPYIVGGHVRDTLLGIRPKDVDIVVVGLPFRQLAALFENSKVVGKDFPVMQVDGVEIALARKERKIGPGHDGFICDTLGVTLEEDLYRRDLTINAMAMNPFTEQIIDPYGGRGDLTNKMLRPVSEHFKEDPLRILRAARFAAQFDMDLTLDLSVMAQEMREELKILTPERVWGETLKALKTNNPQRFFEALNEMEVLEIVFPEIAALKGRIQPEKWHPEGEVFIHFLQVLERARNLDADDETMFAAMCHDLGKAVTPDDDLPRHINHEALGVPIVESLCDRLCIPNSFRRIAVLVAKEHLNIHRFQELKSITQVRLITRLGGLHDKNLLRNICLASMADARGRGPDNWNKPYPQLDAVLKAAEIIGSVRGDQFANITDGNIIAQKLEQARTKILESSR